MELILISLVGGDLSLCVIRGCSVPEGVFRQPVCWWMVLCSYTVCCLAWGFSALMGGPDLSKMATSTGVHNDRYSQDLCLQFPSPSISHSHHLFSQEILQELQAGLAQIPMESLLYPGTQSTWKPMCAFQSDVSEFLSWHSGNESNLESWGWGFGSWPCSVGWGSGIAMSCGVGCRCSLNLALPWLQCKPAVVAPIWPLLWEPPYALGEALKRQKTKKRERMKSLFSPVPWSSCTQVLLALNAKNSGSSSSQYQIASHGNLTWGLELSFPWVNFCNIHFSLWATHLVSMGLLISCNCPSYHLYVASSLSFGVGYLSW